MILAIADDVRSSLLVKSNLAIIDPHSQDLSCIFILARLNADRIQLLLEVLYAL